MNKKVLVAYFSGTGGTKRIADAFEAELQKRDCMVTKLTLEHLGMKENVDPNKLLENADLTILVFAVHAFDAPAPVYHWISQIKQGKYDIAVISVSGGGEVWPNTGCRNKCCKALEEKGFQVVYEKMMVMPCNWVVPINDHLAMWLIKVIPEKVNKILDNLLAGKIRRTPLRMSRLRNSLTQIEKGGTKQFVKALKVQECCTGCGWCARSCPADNIGMAEGKPVFHDACIMCFRCVYGCPNKAISTNHFMVLKQGFDLAAVEKRMEGVALDPIEKLANGLLWIGVKNYLTDKDGY